MIKVPFSQVILSMTGTLIFFVSPCWFESGKSDKDTNARQRKQDWDVPNVHNSVEKAQFIHNVCFFCSKVLLADAFFICIGWVKVQPMGFYPSDVRGKEQQNFEITGCLIKHDLTGFVLKRDKLKLNWKWMNAKRYDVYEIWISAWAVAWMTIMTTMTQGIIYEDDDSDSHNYNLQWPWWFMRKTRMEVRSLSCLFVLLVCFIRSLKPLLVRTCKVWRLGVGTKFTPTWPMVDYRIPVLTNQDFRKPLRLFTFLSTSNLFVNI